MLPSAEALHLRRIRRNLFECFSEQDFEGNRNPQGGAAEAEERVAAGRMKSPEAVPEQRRDTRRQTRSRAKCSSEAWQRKSATIAATLTSLRAPQEDGISRPPLRVWKLLSACPTKRDDGWEKPADLTV
jgi:hypothetical protein